MPINASYSLFLPCSMELEIDAQSPLSMILLLSNSQFLSDRHIDVLKCRLFISVDLSFFRSRSTFQMLK